MAPAENYFHHKSLYYHFTPIVRCVIFSIPQAGINMFNRLMTIRKHRTMQVCDSHLINFIASFILNLPASVSSFKPICQTCKLICYLISVVSLLFLYHCSDSPNRKQYTPRLPI
jgi:hypothetical protein